MIPGVIAVGSGTGEGGSLGPAPSVSRYRLLIRPYDGDQQIRIQELKLMHGIEGDQLAIDGTSGTASASSTEGVGTTYEAANAFNDGADSSYWQSDAAEVADEQWLEFEFDTDTSISCIEIVRDDASNAPVDFDFQYFEDAAWVTAETFVIATDNYDGNSVFANCMFASLTSIGAHTRWRILTRNRPNNGYIWIEELVLKTSSEGDQAAIDGTTGTASASSEFSASYSADRAFNEILDDNGWSSDSFPSPQENWLEFEFDTATAVTCFKLYARTAVSSYGPLDFDIQYHDGSSWQVAASYDITTNDYDNDSAFEDCFTVEGGGEPEPEPDPRYWRIRCVNSNDPDYFGIAELEMRESSGQADQTSTGQATGDYADDGSTIANAFDDNAGTAWYFDYGTRGKMFPTIGQDFGEGETRVINQISITAPTGAEAVRAPTSFVVESSVDLGVWKVVWSVTGESYWASGERRTFVRP